MGHAGIAMTMRYSHLSMKWKQQAILQVPPFDEEIPLIPSPVKSHYKRFL
jgi:hypothetical protein